MSNTAPNISLRLCQVIMDDIGSTGEVVTRGKPRGRNFNDLVVYIVPSVVMH